MHYHHLKQLVLLPLLAVIASCGSSGPGMFGKKTPHEQYSQRIKDAGLHETALGRSWFNRADESIRTPLRVTIPYKETGFFASDKPDAAGLVFEATRGEKLIINLIKNPSSGFLVYMDLWEQPEAANTQPKLLASLDTVNTTIEHEVKKTGLYILRVQPELLISGQYTLSILSNPSLAFPVPAAKGKVGSIWGVDRDGGARRHEGIDIFAPFRSPVIAAAGGTVTRVNTNNLGGKVVWLNPRNADYTLYYAHLDEQIATPGQVVKEGDTLGLVGNTGNARNTPSHLHFGIYASGGAINPLPFVKQDNTKPATITASLNNLGKQLRSTGKNTRLYQEPGGKPAEGEAIAINTLMSINAATAGWYKVALPDGRKGYITDKMLTSVSTPIRKYNTTREIPMLSKPEINAPQIKLLPAGTGIEVLASFGEYQYVRNDAEHTGWIYGR